MSSACTNTSGSEARGVNGFTSFIVDPPEGGRGVSGKAVLLSSRLLTHSFIRLPVLFYGKNLGRALILVKEIRSIFPYIEYKNCSNLSDFFHHLILAGC